MSHRITYYKADMKTLQSSVYKSNENLHAVLWVNKLIIKCETFRLTQPSILINHLSRFWTDILVDGGKRLSSKFTVGNLNNFSWT